MGVFSHGLKPCRKQRQLCMGGCGGAPSVKLLCKWAFISQTPDGYRLKDPKKVKLRSSYSMKQCLCMSHCVHMFIRFLCSGRGSDGGEEDITPIYFFFFVVLVGKRLCSTFHERYGPNPKPYGIDSRWRNFTRRTRLVAKRQCRPVL